MGVVFTEEILRPFYSFNAAPVDNVVTSQFQRYTADFRSYELNSRSWGWDVVSTVAGLRVIDFSEDMAFVSNNAFTPAPAAVPIIGRGNFTQDVDNFMFGGQLGIDLMYPVLRRMLAGAKFRGGVFANSIELNTHIFQDLDINDANPASTVLRNRDEDLDIAGLWEQSFFMTYQIAPSLAVKAGYELWYLANISTLEAHRAGVLSTGYGSRIQHDDVFIHGGFVSVEGVF